MISQISVENFKPLKKIDTPLSNLNLLMGLNGMGKSSYLQVLLLLVQSNLEDREIDLSGLLAQIGKGRDAFYQFAPRDASISLKITFDDGHSYQWVFPYVSDKEKLIASCGYSKREMAFFRESIKHFQYFNAERIGPRDIYDASSIVVADKKQLGFAGEYAAYYLNLYGLEYIVPERLRRHDAFSEKLIYQLNAWMQEISPGVLINTKYVPEVNKVILDYQFEVLSQKTDSFRPKNVGFGISYVLPVVLALLTAEKGKIIVIENPEAHIHPRGQAELGKLMALAANTGAQLFIETHSDHILNGIRVAVRERLIDKSIVNIMYFDKETVDMDITTKTDAEQFAKITQIRVDDNGELSDYPKDFLDEWTNQLLKLV